MSIDLREPPPPPEWPDGLHVEAFDPESNPETSVHATRETIARRTTA